MKKIFFLLAAIPFFAIAQKTKTISKPKVAKPVIVTGVHFQHKVVNWDNLITQAKKENKFLFVDCYTTWCGPCKYVSSTIFPMKNVGEFFNKNFVNVKLQIDETKKDNEDVIATRSVAKYIEETYKINVYPTFLIFDNAGKLVHKFCGAGDDKFMIANAGSGLNKDEQYYTLVEGFKAGNRDGNFITKLCKASAAANDNVEEYLKAFIETQTNLFTKDNAELLLSNVENTDGIVFKNLYENKEKWLPVADKEMLESVIANAISTEIVSEIFNEKNTEVDWAGITKKYNKKYPGYAKEQVAKAKVIYYSDLENWKEFAEALKVLLKENPNAFTQKNALNSIAWSVFENIDDKELLNEALTLSKKSLEGGEVSAYLDTYANILYKLGQTKEAIDTESKALSKATSADEKKNYQETLDKMKKGEKTWK